MGDRMRRVGLLVMVTVVLGLSGVENDLLWAQANEAQEPTTVQDHINLAITQLTSDYGEALKHALNAVTLADELQNLPDQLNAYRFTGAITMNMGLTDISADYTGRFLELAQQAKDERQIAYAYFNLGAIRLVIGQYEEGRKLFENAQQRLEALAQKEGTEVSAQERITILSNLGLAAMESENYIQADAYFKEGIELAQAENIIAGGLTNLLNGYGMSLLRQSRQDSSKTETAISIQQSAIELNQQLNNLPGLGTGLLTLGELYELQGAMDQAEETYLQGYQIAEQLEAPGVLNQFAKSLYQLYETNGDYEKATQYRKLYEQHQQKVNAQKAQEEVTRAELTAEFRQRESELNEEVDRQRVWVVLLWFGGVMLAVAIVFITVQSRKRVRMVSGEHIEAQREQLKKALNEFVTSNGAKEKWDEFETRFEGVYGEFHKELARRHPDLTPNERRLCVFLRLDMTTKEITSITGQTLRAVEMGRIRLRKKLNLTNSEQGLFEYLSSF